MKKWLAIGLAVLLVLAGCASGGSNGGGKDSGSGGQGTQNQGSGGQGSGSDSKKPVELSLWIFLNPQQTDDPRSVALKNIVDSFNESQDNIRVKVESIHYSKIDSQVIQAVSAGGGPDILNVYTDMLNLHVDAKTIQPMTKYAEQWIREAGGDYIYSADQLKLNGEIMSLPWEARVFTVFYRQDLLDEKGLSAPKTLAEWQEVAKQTAGDNRLGFAVGLSEGANAASFVETFIPLLRAYGGAIFDADGKASFNSEAGVKAIEFIKDMVASGAMNEQAVSMTADDVTNGLKAGSISTAISGSMRASAIRGSDIGQHIKTMPVPPAEEGQPSPTMVAGQTLSIGVNTKYPDEAFEFIKYFLTKESQIKWAGAGVMPVLSSAYEDPAVKELATYDEMISWKEEASKSGQIVFYPEDYAKLSVELAKAAQQMVFQNAPVKETLDKVAAQYNQGK